MKQETPKEIAEYFQQRMKNLEYVGGRLGNKAFGVFLLTVKTSEYTSKGFEVQLGNKAVNKDLEELKVELCAQWFFTLEVERLKVIAKDVEKYEGRDFLDKVREAYKTINSRN